MWHACAPLLRVLHFCVLAGELPRVLHAACLFRGCMQTYVALFGGNQSMLEALTVKRGIMGPQWLFLSRPSRVAPSATTSWCRVEVTLPSSKDVGE